MKIKIKGIKIDEAIKEGKELKRGEIIGTVSGYTDNKNSISITIYNLNKSIVEDINAYFSQEENTKYEELMKAKKDLKYDKEGVDISKLVDISKKEDISILFVGNSRTFVEDIPGKFEELAKAGNHKVDITEVTIGGATLLQLSGNEYDENGALKENKRDVITSKPFDYTILQEQSDAYVTYLSTYLSGAKKVKELVESKNPSVNILARQTWAYQNSSQDEENQAFENARTVAEQINAKLVLDGKAFNKSKSMYPSINLFADDVHQSKEGAYLSACCIYCTIYNKSPVGLEYYGGLSEDTAKNYKELHKRKWNV